MGILRQTIEEACKELQSPDPKSAVLDEGAKSSEHQTMLERSSKKRKRTEELSSHVERPSLFDLGLFATSLSVAVGCMIRYTTVPEDIDEGRRAAFSA